VALSAQTLSDWGGGMFRQRISPPAGAYDLTNMLIGDDSLPFKRGGTAYFAGSDAGSTLTRLAAFYCPAVAVDRAVAWGTGNILCAYSQAGVLSQVATSVAAPSRFVSVGGFAVAAVGAPSLIYYGGSLKTANYSTGTISTMTIGSATVTGSGTSWLANVDAGMLLDAGPTPLVVKSVDSNTQLTLMVASPYATPAAGAYTLRPVYSLGPNLFGMAGSQTFVASAGQRLIMTIGNRAYLTPRNNPFSFNDTDYHELPSGSVIIGAEGVGDSVILFTTRGVWRIDNLELDILDDFGNIQQSVTQIAKEFALWNDLGITGWQGQVIVPALDDLFLYSPSGSAEPITQWTIRSLYRSYVKAGYTPGQSVTFRGHAFIPIMNGSTIVDVLVCRLDRPHMLSSRPRIWIYPFTRFSGHGAGAGYAALNTSGSPKLLSINGLRVTDLTSTFDPATTNAVEADGTTHTATIESNDLPTGSGQPGFVKKARATYVLTDDGNGGTAAPTVALAVSSDEDAGAYTTLTDSGLQRGGTAGAVSDGTRYSWWTVSKRRQRVRFKITQTGACASFVLRSFSFFSRGSGKQ
jgi:hypothetical protein